MRGQATRGSGHFRFSMCSSKGAYMKRETFVGGATVPCFGGYLWATSPLVKLQVTQAGITIGPSGSLARMLTLGWMAERTYTWQKISRAEYIPPRFLRSAGVQLTFHGTRSHLSVPRPFRDGEMRIVFYSRRVRELLTTLREHGIEVE